MLVLAGAAGRVLGAGEGGTEELITVFGRFVMVTVAAGAVVVVVDEMGLVVLPEEVASFVCPSFAS